MNNIIHKTRPTLSLWFIVSTSPLRATSKKDQPSQIFEKFRVINMRTSLLERETSQRNITSFKDEINTLRNDIISELELNPAIINAIILGERQF